MNQAHKEKVVVELTKMKLLKILSTKRLMLYIYFYYIDHILPAKRAYFARLDIVICLQSTRHDSSRG